MNGSGLTGAYLPTPPPDDHFPFPTVQGRDAIVSRSGLDIDTWMEIWDYAGGASFRAFVTTQGQERSLFAFFDMQGVIGRDLKKG